MILYLDTSSLVKLYLLEDATQQTRAIIAGAESVTTSWLTYTEARATFARKYRENHISAPEYQVLLLAFEEQWSSYATIEVTTSILRQAADMAAKHRLRALDAIHLASALDIRRLADPLGESVAFLSSDARLMQAVRAEEFNTPSTT